MRRLRDYVNYNCPQFAATDISFQRLPTVDTSNPFIARYIPPADESFAVIRFRNPKGIDVPYLLSILHDSLMSRPNIIVVPGGKMEIAMQIILTSVILKMMDTRRRAGAAHRRGPPRTEVPLAELLSSGHVVDLIIALMVIEALVLLVWRRRLGHGIASGPLLAGFFLLLALRGALTGAAWHVIALWLAAALGAHLGDLKGRWKR